MWEISKCRHFLVATNHCRFSGKLIAMLLTATIRSNVLPFNVGNIFFPLGSQIVWFNQTITCTDNFRQRVKCVVNVERKTKRKREREREKETMGWKRSRRQINIVSLKSTHSRYCLKMLNSCLPTRLYLTVNNTQTFWNFTAYV